jgi:glycosyltransferase involved in cell wall biosynthesis
MNILVLNAVRGWSGIGSHSIELALSLKKKGHMAVIGCAQEVNVRHHAKKLGIPLRKIRLKNLMDIRAIFKIMQVVFKDDIELIIANLGKEYWPATFVAKILGRKIIVIRHQTNRLKKITCWLLARYVDRVVAVSDAVADSLIAGGVPAEKIDLVHNAINLERFNPFSVDRDRVRKELGVGDDDIVIGTAGRLVSEKGVSELLNATYRLIQENRPVKLIFAGDGPSKTALAEEAHRLSIHDRVIFLGLRKDMDRIYAAMDIFVFPSTQNEAFGMVLIEAMAMNKPVVASAVGGILDIVRDGINGILIPPRDHVAIATAVARLIDDQDLSGKIAREGQKTVEQRFSDKAMGDTFEKILEKIVRPRPSGRK